MQKHSSDQSRLSSSATDFSFTDFKQVMPSSNGQVLVNRRPLVNFASADVLGLAVHPAVKQRSIDYIQRFGAAAGGSRAGAGNVEPCDFIERKLASLIGTERALLLCGGPEIVDAALPI